MAVNEEEIQLLKASIKGDTDAFERIVYKYQGYICAVTFSAVGDIEKSEELAHETFISAWKSLDQLRDLKKFRGWLGTIARNVIRNSYRAKKRDIINSAAPIDAVDQSAIASDEDDTQALVSERLALVEQALKGIPKKYREVIVLYYRQEQSIKEVAAQLELSEDVIKQRLSRGRKMLKDQAAEMIETTISRTGPSKAFTACVMASVISLALKGAATAGIATTAGASSIGTASGLNALFGTVTAKVITAAAVAVIAVSGAVVYKNFKTPDIQQNNPVKVVDRAQDRGIDKPENSGSVGKIGNEIIASLQPETSIVESFKTEPVKKADIKEKPQVAQPQFIDPNTLTDIYLKHSIITDGNESLAWEYWYKKPDIWHFNDPGNAIYISDGKRMLVLNKKNKTAQYSDTVDGIPDFQSRLMSVLTRVGQDLINGRKPGKDFDKMFHDKNEYYLDKEKSTEEIKVYHLITGEYFPKDFYVDSKTGLVQKFIMTRSSGTLMVCDLEYSVIPRSVFTLKIPESYEKLVNKLPPTFQGWIFDKDLKPVSDAKIYLFGKRRNFVKGKSNSEGEFNFNIPVTNIGSRDPLVYPIFVRAVSDAHPGQVAWTVIKDPDNKEKMPSFIPSPGEVFTQKKNRECHSIQNVTLILEPAGTVTGRVLDISTNKPVKNAQVRLRAYCDGYFDEIPGNSSRGDYLVNTRFRG